MNNYNHGEKRNCYMIYDYYDNEPREPYCYKGFLWDGGGYFIRYLKDDHKDLVKKLNDDLHHST